MDFVAGAYKSGGVPKPESFGSEELSIAGATVDFLVWAIASQHRVKRPVALRAVKAFLVPHLRNKQVCLYN